MSLVLVMIYEEGKERNSKWFPYLQVLPRTFDTLVYWSEEELAQLQGCAVLDKIGKEGAEEMFTELLFPIVTKHFNLFGRFAQVFAGPEAHAELIRLAHCMATLVMAYGFDLDTDELPEDADDDGFVEDDEENSLKGMIPYADMLHVNGVRHNVSSPLWSHADIPSPVRNTYIFTGQTALQRERCFGRSVTGHQEWRRSTY